MNVLVICKITGKPEKEIKKLKLQLKRLSSDLTN